MMPWLKFLHVAFTLFSRLNLRISDLESKFILFNCPNISCPIKCVFLFIATVFFIFKTKVPKRAEFYTRKSAPISVAEKE